MTVKEVQAIMEALYEDFQDSWNQTRFTAFVQACSSGAKLNKPQDLLRFAWDIEAPPEVIPIEEILRRQNELIQAMNNPDKQVFKPF